jgi:hypothetical protein
MRPRKAAGRRDAASVRASDTSVQESLTLTDDDARTCIGHSRFTRTSMNTASHRRNIMLKTYASGVALAVLAALPVARAQDGGQTRAQVKAEEAKAKAAGQIPSGDLDRTPAQVNPKRYPSSAPTSSLTREQVKAETKAAVRAGDVEVGDLGETQAEKDPPRYAGAPAKPPKLHLHRSSKKAKAAASAASN